MEWSGPCSCHDGAEDAEARGERGEIDGGVLERLGHVRLETLLGDGRAKLAKSGDLAELAGDGGFGDQRGGDADGGGCGSDHLTATLGG